MGKYFNKRNLFNRELIRFLVSAWQGGDIPKSGIVRKTVLHSLLKSRTFEGAIKFIDPTEFPEVLQRENYILDSDDAAMYEFDVAKLKTLLDESLKWPMEFVKVTYCETVCRAKKFECPDVPQTTCFVCNENFGCLRDHFAQVHNTNLLEFIFPKQNVTLGPRHFRLILNLASDTKRPQLTCKNESDIEFVVHQIYMVVDGDIIESLLKIPAHVEANGYVKVELNIRYFDHIDNEFLFVIISENAEEIIETFSLVVNGLVPDFIIQNRKTKRDEADRIDFNDNEPRRSLPEYSIKQCLKKFFNDSWSFKAQMSTVDLDAAELQDFEVLNAIFAKTFRLIESNYIQALSLLTYIEDLFISFKLSMYSITFKVDKAQRQMEIDISDQDFLQSMISEVDSIMLFRTDIEKARRQGARIKFGCTIHSIHHGIVTFSAITGDIVPGTYRVKFEKDRTCTKMELNALSRLDFLTVQVALFPKVAGHFTKDVKSLYAIRDTIAWFNAAIENNNEQQKAVCDIVNGIAYPAPYLLFGPPGTGKSTVLVEAIAQIYKLKPKSRILLAAPSNFACDEIASRLMQYIPSSDIYRLYSKSFERKMDDIEDPLILVSNLVEGTHEMPTIALIRQYRLVVATLVACGRLSLQTMHKNEFDYIFIDECASASEQATLIPISGMTSFRENGTPNIVLAGDPKQLSPMWSCAFVRDSFNSRSMLERLSEDPLYRSSDHVITHLIDNYRSHPAILHAFNEVFYAGKLIAKAQEFEFVIGWKYLPNLKFPMIFHGVYGECGTAENSFSLINEEEVAKVLFYVTEIMRSGINGFAISLSDIGIVTPYQAQVQCIKKMFSRYGWYDIEVGSAEQYQGREKLIMIISTVRSFTNTLGFLDNPRRMNVLLSRAKALLIIVGNPHTLKMDHNWQKLIRYCELNQATIDFDLAKLDGELGTEDVIITGHTEANDEDMDRLSCRLQELDTEFR